MTQHQSRPVLPMTHSPRSSGELEATTAGLPSVFDQLSQRGFHTGQLKFLASPGVLRPNRRPSRAPPP